MHMGPSFYSACFLIAAAIVFFLDMFSVQKGRIKLLSLGLLLFVLAFLILHIS